MVTDPLQRRWDVTSLATGAVPLLATGLALVVSAALIAAVGKDPVQAYTALFAGAFGSVGQLATTVTEAIPLIFAGLAVALAFRGGAFNIGGEGQLYMGALLAAVVGGYLHLPAIVELPLAIVSAFVGGAVWGGVAGWLKASRGFNEVIVTILLNYIALWFVSYLVHGPIKAPGWNIQSPDVDPAAQLPIVVPGTSLHAGIILGLLCAVLVYVLIERTTLGFQIRLVGANALGARYAGVPVGRLLVLTMALSGGLAGLTGAGEILGVQFRLLDGFSAGWGYDAIAVALIGQLNPFGTVVAALFFGALRAGANNMQTVVQLPVAMVYVVQALAVLFMIVGASFKFKRRRRVPALRVPLREPALQPAVD